MGLSLKEEVAVLFACILSGILTGILYDIFRILRKGKTPSKTVVFVQDILFWIVDAFLVFYLMYATCDGELRWYDAPLIIFGFLIYHYTISRLFVNTGFFVLGISLNFTSKVLRFLFFPLRFLLKFLLFLKKLFKKSKFFKKIRKIRLTYRNFCFKIKKSVHKICCVLFKDRRG